VLVVEDQDASRFIIREILRGHDYEVVEVSRGEEAIGQARQLKPSVILLDLHLGDVDGVDLREALRRDPETAHVPVVVVTSRVVGPSDRERLGPSTPVVAKSNLTREILRGEMQRAIDAAESGEDR
jgi:CheY-like chemotaxis protein